MQPSATGHRATLSDRVLQAQLERLCSRLLRTDLSSAACRTIKALSPDVLPPVSSA